MKVTSDEGLCTTVSKLVAMVRAKRHDRLDSARQGPRPPAGAGEAHPTQKLLSAHKLEKATQNLLEQSEQRLLQGWAFAWVGSRVDAQRRVRVRAGLAVTG